MCYFRQNIFVSISLTDTFILVRKLWNIAFYQPFLVMLCMGSLVIKLNDNTKAIDKLCSGGRTFSLLHELYA